MRRFAQFFPVAILAAVSSIALSANYPKFNIRAATQTFSPQYGFSTTETRLVETARCIYEMGSDAIKLGMDQNVWTSYQLTTSRSSFANLADVAQNEPSFRTVFDMPLSTYIMWAAPLTIGNSAYFNYWRDGLDSSEAALEYNEIKALATYFLQHYNGTGKTFILGHWEGDWAVRGNYNPDSDPGATAFNGMIDWLTVRQRAVTDARNENSGSDVKVYCYGEANLVLAWLHWSSGQKIITNEVFPHVALDLLSYSAYDSAYNLEPLLYFPSWFIDCLSYIDSKTTSTTPFPKHVMVGEYGMNLSGHTAQEQANLARDVIKAAVGWGSPYVLYWQMYDNEGIGYWLINSSNVKQPSWYVYHNYSGRAHCLKNLYRYWMHRNPTDSELSTFGATYDTWQASAELNTILASTEYRNMVSNAQFLQDLFAVLLGVTSTSDADYIAYLSQLNTGTSRASVLDSILNSSRFSATFSNLVFARMLYYKTLQRAPGSVSQTELNTVVSRLASGTTRSAIWREFISSAEFYEKEISIRDIDQIGSPVISQKYYFDIGSAAARDWERLY